MATDAMPERPAALPGAPRLTRRLREVVRAKRRFLAARALLVTGLACLTLAAVLICADVALAFGPAGRWAAFALLAASVALLLAARLVMPCRRYGEHEAVCDLEAACDGVGQLLRTSAEVAREGDAKGFSPALSRALLHQAEETLLTAPMERVIPWPALRRWGLGLGVVGCLFALALVLWPDFRRGAVRLVLPAAPVTFTRVDLSVTPESFERGQTVRLAARVSGRPPDRVELAMRLPGAGWAPVPLDRTQDGAWSAEFAGLHQSFEVRFRAGDARVRRRIRFLDPPVVLEAAADVQYPPYMRLPPAACPLDDLRLPEGASVRFRFTLNHALVKASVVLPDGSRQPAERADAGLTWGWTAVPGRHVFGLAGEDAEGLPLKPFAWEVVGIPDHRPVVTLETPEEDLSLTPIGETPVQARVQDDFGIAAAEIILTVDGQEHRLEGRETEDAPRHLRLTADLRLEDLGLEPGTPVRLHARARDFRPDRPGWSVSDVRVITIRPLKILRPPPEPAPDQTGQGTEQLEEDLAALEKAIERQKEALQDTLSRREEQPEAPSPMPETAAAEREIAEAVRDIAQRADAGQPPPEQTPGTPPPAGLLQQAEENLQSAAEALAEPQLPEALRREDRALSAMMQARDLMQAQLDRQRAAQNETRPQDQPPTPPPETAETLAERAEALARTERQIRNDVAPTQAPAAAQTPPEPAVADTRSAQAPQPGQQQATQDTPGQQTLQQTPDQAARQDTPGQQTLQQTPDQMARQDTPGQQTLQQTPDQAARQGAAGEAGPQPPAAAPEEVAQAARRQEEAVREARDLTEDVRRSPEATALAARRMADAARTMEQALRELREQDPQAAAQTLQEAQHELEELATHLRGLDPARAAETLARAAAMAEQASQQLRGEPPPAEPVARTSTPQAPPQEPGTPPPAEPVARTSTPQAPPQEPGTPPPAEPPPPADDTPGPAPEVSAAVARSAETMDDWLKRLAAEPARGLEATREELRRLRREQNTETLADEVTQAAEDRLQGRTEQARQTEQDAARRLETMAGTLDQEHQRLVRSRLEQLAAAETDARELQAELAREARAAQPTPPETTERLRQLAGRFQDLRDAPLDRVARELRQELPPQPPPGARPQGVKLPEQVHKETLPAGLNRLRTLIDEIVRRELLVDRDARVPEEYSRLVESYFKALSDDQK